MLTGRRLFDGASTTDVLAAVLADTPVLTAEPDWSRLPPAPPLVLRLLRRCPQKDRSSRLHDIGDARIDIDEALAEARSDIVPAGSRFFASCRSDTGSARARRQLFTMTRSSTSSTAVAAIDVLATSSYPGAVIDDGFRLPRSWAAPRRQLPPSLRRRKAVLPIFSQLLQRKILADVAHAQWVVTLPKMLRPYFLFHRELLGELARLA